MARILTLLFFVTTSNLHAQVSDDFTDGDFTANPVWSGDDSDFAVTSGELQLLNTVTDDSHLMTASTLASNGTWEFLFRWEGFAPTGLSSSNEVFFYLVADQNVAPEAMNIQGYFVRIGNTQDEISLYRQDTDIGSVTEIIDGNANAFGGVTASSSGSIRIRAINDGSGNWTLYADISGGTNFVEVGSVAEATYSSGNFSGIFIDYSSGNADGYFFDDISITSNSTPDTDPPVIQSVTAISGIQVDVTFNENVEETTAETIGNYSLNGGFNVTAAMRDDTNNAIVHLTTDMLTNGDSYTLTINNIEDENSNVIATDSEGMFEYLFFETVDPFDVVINEFMADPDPDNGLPNADFVELYNPSSKFIQLENWTIGDNSTTQTLGSFVLRPQSYLIICDNSFETEFDALGDVLSVGSFPNLNSSTADAVTLKDPSDLTIAEVSYGSNLIQDGITLEMVNPNGPDYSTNNYGLSTDPDGGTPGAQNSIFNDTPDTTPPILSSISVISSTELDLTFDEPVDEATSEVITNYSADGGIAVSVAARDDSDNSIVHLTVSELVSGETRTLTVNNVQDLSANAIASNTVIEFEYIKTTEAAFREVVVNEFYAIPNDEGSLPNAEYIELLNISVKFINLQNWTLSDATGTSGTLPSFILRPGSYVILIPPGETTSFQTFGDVIEVPSMKSLNNSGDDIRVTNENAVDIYQVSYTSATAGISTELINPNGPDYSANNYGLSTNTTGGTPGEQNSTFDDTPDTTPPTISSISVVSSTKLDLTFSEPVDEATAETIANYSVDGGINVESAMRDDSDNSIVHLTVSTLVSTEMRTLTINNVLDLSVNPVAPGATVNFEYVETVPASSGDVVINEFLGNPLNDSDDFVELYNRSDKYLNLAGWKLSDESSTTADFSSFVLRPDSYVIIFDRDAMTGYASLGDALTVPSLTLNNTNDQIEILDESDNRIAFLAYGDQPDEGISSELINPDDPCISELSYSASTDGSGNTAGNQNTVFDDTPDTIAPTVLSYGFDETLTIYFSEVMDASSLMDGTYTISGLTVSDISVSEFPTSVELTFQEPLNSGLIYELSIASVNDCWGNMIAETTINFGQGRPPQFNELLITEIQFDPDPSVGLPDIEFIEVYNNTDDLLDLNEVRFSDATSSVDLPVVTLTPREYYVLTTRSGASEFASVNAIGVSGFLSLSNSGEQLILSSDDELVFSVNYNPDWHDEEKEEGGFTLEMKDITNPCAEEFNWGSSSSIKGGTPGLENSISEVVPDNFGPEVVQVTAISVDSIRVDFSEKINPASEQTGIVSITPALIINTLYFDQKSPASLFIVLNEDLVESNEHTIQLSGITDCNGNEIQTNEITFALPSIAVKGDILLSEVLFNPRTNGVDFVEIYNASEKYLSMRNWLLGRVTEEGVSDQKIVLSEELIVPPGAFQVFTTDVTILSNNYPKGITETFVEMASLPTYANDTGNVVLINSSEEVLELFHYDDDYHYSLLESTDGVSLERISYEVDVNDQNNWRSASSTQGFATPGYKNSQSFSVDVPSGNVEADPKVFIPGNTGSGRDFTTINYQFDQPGKFANVTIYDQNGRLIKTLAEGVLLATSGFMRWDGATNNGELARLGYYVVLFEIFDSSGNTETIKETVVVGRDF